VKNFHDEPLYEEQIFLSDRHIQDLFHQFNASQPLGSRLSSSHVSNMENQSFFNPPPSLEEEIRLSQPLNYSSLPHVATIATSHPNPTMPSPSNPDIVIYHYDPTYDNPPSSNMPFLPLTLNHKSILIPNEPY